MRQGDAIDGDGAVPAVQYARRPSRWPGAAMEATIDGKAVAYWKPVEMAAGRGAGDQGVACEFGGVRAYLAIRGGCGCVPQYLGSKATFTLGKFGGHAGRALRAGDVLRLGPSTKEGEPAAPLDPRLVPTYTNAWEIGVLYGPHGAPDFFTPDDIDVFFQTAWKVHYNSDRTGVRLIGPHPKWARTDGGEAGLHPSNIHDNAYAIGTVDFTGNMPVVLGPDGPCLGICLPGHDRAGGALEDGAGSGRGIRYDFMRW